jgi:hypothetical protein
MYRWEDNITMDLKELVWVGVEWSYMTQDRDHWWAHVNMVMNLQSSLKGREFFDSVAISFSRRTLLLGVSQLVNSCL